MTIAETGDAARERRTRRLLLVFIAGLIPLALVVVLKGYPKFWLQSYSLTALLYGHLLFVDEWEHIREEWLLRALLPVTAIHLVFVAGIFYWNRFADPEMLKPILVMVAVWVLVLPEYFLVSIVIELLRPKGRPRPPT